MRQKRNILDYVGKRQGRVTILRPLESYRGGKREVLGRCDCGNVFITIASSVYDGSPISCGCVKREQRKIKFRCPACGSYFDGDLSKNPTQQFCPECAPKYRVGTWRVCAVCKQLFRVAEDKNAETCSPACSEQWMKRVDPLRIKEQTRQNHEPTGPTDSTFDGQKERKTSSSRLKGHPGVYQYGNHWKVFTKYHGAYKYCVSFDNLDDAIRCSDLLRSCANDEEIDALLTEIREKKKGRKRKTRTIVDSRTPKYICERTITGTKYFSVYRSIEKRQVVVGYFPTLEEAQPVAEKAKSCTTLEELLSLKEEIKSQRKEPSKHHPGVNRRGERWAVYARYRGAYRYCATFNNLDDANYYSGLLRNCTDDSEIDALLGDACRKNKTHRKKPKYISKYPVNGQTRYDVCRCIDGYRVKVGRFLTLAEAQLVAERVKNCVSPEELLALKAEIKSQRENK